MRVIGITGGVGAGKSAVMDYIAAKFRSRTLKADEIAHTLMEPGNRAYDALRRRLPEAVFSADGRIDRLALAQLIFEEPDWKEQVNEIVHPAVKTWILDVIAEEKMQQAVDYVFIEAALLIEDHYDEICDELWYIYASVRTRERRLMESRSYSREKIFNILNSQLSESEYRRHSQAVIDNDGSQEAAFRQIDQLLAKAPEGEAKNMKDRQLVFGLDIGTRNVVGLAGYREENEFFVIASNLREHETRSMLDGQIHDIGRVGATIRKVKAALEQQLAAPLNEVCIAAAGRVLKTVQTSVEYDFSEETVVEREHIHTLELLGVEQAQRILRETNDTRFRFYTVGYSVVKYYLNDDYFSNLEGHKAKKIRADIIVTFLPEDVVDGLYTAVSLAELTVVNLTLEPIAAINVAIPEAFRMLNIAMVDVGAGTSDISITKDGSIIAYGMIPSAGDEITELLVQHYLVDFKTAEQMKIQSGTAQEVEYTDIMSLTHKIPSAEVWKLTDPLAQKLAQEVAGKIIELNGERSVSAAFVVGGGGKVHDFIKFLAEALELPEERVALRGEEVLRDVHFSQDNMKKDPLLVTPVGICLNYYEQRNNFIFVHFNGERMKLYDNNHLTVVDAAMAAGFPNEQLFPRRGKEISFTVNGGLRIARGEAGESSIVKMNGQVVSINTPLEANAEIMLESSTVGEDAHYTLEQLPESQEATLTVTINDKLITLPKFLEVNGSLEPPNYRIMEGDQIETRGYYTIAQIIAFMDVEVDTGQEIYVNNSAADMAALVYDNFTVTWTLNTYRTHADDVITPELPVLHVEANGEKLVLSGKEEYIFVDLFSAIHFDINEDRGRALVTKLNGLTPGYLDPLKEGDVIEIYWSEER